MSKRHPGARRVAHNTSHGDEDAFIAGILQAGNWTRANQQMLTIAGIVVVLVIAVVVYMGNVREAAADEAARRLDEIHGMVAFQDPEGATRALVLFVDQFGGTPYGGEGRLLLGDLYLRSGQADKAVAVLEPLGKSPRSPLELQAGVLLGAAYEENGDADEAETVYLRVGDRSELDFEVRGALANAARLRAQRGDVAGAVELYDRVIDTFEESAPGRSVYEMRRQELLVAMG
ncbi:MAG: tetratricopeptide repeat protein [Gemmatimonadota bacterium]|nr:tetratricopeptide repeat protein [Gemmatimonadota bacterium]MDH5760352.1 tetratricopeptide repeat protein [Gemmatimonadota bacterium]